MTTSNFEPGWLAHALHAAIDLANALGSDAAGPKTPQAMVREFHHAFGHPAPERLAETIQGAVADLRLRLLEEELEEVREAVRRGDVVNLAQELADLVYVAYGHAITNGIDLDAVIAEVHRANMSKLGPDGKANIRPDGKVLKSENYRPPDVAGVLGKAGKV